MAFSIDTKPYFFLYWQSQKGIHYHLLILFAYHYRSALTDKRTKFS